MQLTYWASASLLHESQLVVDLLPIDGSAARWTCARLTCGCDRSSCRREKLSRPLRGRPRDDDLRISRVNINSATKFLMCTRRLRRLRLERSTHKKGPDMLYRWDFSQGGKWAQ